MEIELDPSVSLKIDKNRIEDIVTKLPNSHTLERFHPEWLENLINFPIQPVNKPSMEDFFEFPDDAKELILVNQLLLAFSGTSIPPFFIMDEETEKLSMQIDDSTRSMLSRFFDLFCNLEKISFFVNSFEINDSPSLSKFAQSLRTVLHDFHKKLGSIQRIHDSSKGPLTLLELQIKINAEVKLFEELAKLCYIVENENVYEARLIDLLKQSYLESLSNKQVFSKLIVDVSENYFLGLKNFLLKGDLETAQKNEVPIYEHSNTKRESTTWFLNGMAIKSKLPEPISKSQTVTQILKTGRNMMIMNKCKKKVELSENAFTLFYYPSFQTENNIIESIKDLYNITSKAVFEYIVNEKRVDILLKYITNYFLLKSSEWVLEFFEMTETQMLAQQADMVRLKRTFESVLTKSSYFRSDIAEITFKTSESDMINSIAAMNGQTLKHGDELPSSSVFELIELEVKFSTDFGYIIDDIVLEKYNLIFRRLFSLTFVTHILNKAWVKLMKIKDSQITTLLSNVYDMVLFFRNVMFYFSSFAVSESFQNFIDDYTQAVVLEDIVEAHTKLVDSILLLTFLSDVEISELLSKIVDKTLVLTKIIDSIDDTGSNLLDKAGEIVSIKEQWGQLVEELSNIVSVDSSYDEFIMHLFGQ